MVVHVGRGTYPLEKFKYMNILGTCMPCISKQFRVAQFNKKSCLVFKVSCVYCFLLKSEIDFLNLLPSYKESTIFYDKHLGKFK